jgi:hypothetical protein
MLTTLKEYLKLDYEQPTTDKELTLFKQTLQHDLLTLQRIPPITDEFAMTFSHIIGILEFLLKEQNYE